MSSSLSTQCLDINPNRDFKLAFLRRFVSYHVYAVGCPLMHNIDRQRYHNFNPQSTPRSSRENVNHASRPMPWWFKLISPWLFWMPHVYLNDLREIWKDDDSIPTLNIKLWNEFINKLADDWNGSTTPVRLIFPLLSLRKLTLFKGDCLIISECRISCYPIYRRSDYDKQIPCANRLICFCTTQLVCIHLLSNIGAPSQTSDRKFGK